MLSKGPELLWNRYKQIPASCSLFLLMLDIVAWLALVFFSEFALVSFHLGPRFQDAKLGVGVCAGLCQCTEACTGYQTQGVVGIQVSKQEKAEGNSSGSEVWKYPALYANIAEACPFPRLLCLWLLTFVMTRKAECYSLIVCL
jgi:hypothetical protein